MEDTQEEKKKIDFFAEKEPDVEEEKLKWQRSIDISSGIISNLISKVAGFTVKNKFETKAIVVLFWISFMVGIITTISFLIIHYWVSISIIGGIIILKELSKLKNKKRNGN